MTAVYPTGFWCGYRQVAARHGEDVLTVTRWTHNSTSWMSLEGSLTGITVRALAHVLRSESLSTVVVINGAELTMIDPQGVTELHVIIDTAIKRGLQVDLVDAPWPQADTLSMTSPAPPPMPPGPPGDYHDPVATLLADERRRRQRCSPVSPLPAPSPTGTPGYPGH